LCALLAACGAVNADAGRSATDRYALLDRAAAPAGSPMVPSGRAEADLYGAFPEDIDGSITYLGDTVDFSGRGVVVVGPGSGRGERITSRFHEPNQFPYEVVTAESTKDGLFLTAIQVVNPLDSRIGLQCTIATGIKFDPGDSIDEDSGQCAGGTTLQSTSKVVGRRDARWSGRDVRLVTTETNIVFSGAITGTLKETNDIPQGDRAVALRTTLDVDIEQSGTRFAQQLVRDAVPRVEEK
jgi:hypothetical protein